MTPRPKTLRITASELRLGDSIYMTRAVSWKVLAITPYTGPLLELLGSDAIIVDTDRGGITCYGELEILEARGEKRESRVGL